MDSHTSTPASQAWSQLWSQTSQGSLDLDGSDPLATALRNHWAAQLPWLASLSKVLDVGSGPAVLARHLNSSSPVGALDGLRWWCVDSAELPASVAPSARIQLLGNTDFATARPVHGPFDGLVSNFGIEYVPREHLAAACGRWLRVDARLSAVVHAKASVIDQTARQTMGDITHTLASGALFDCAADLFVAIKSLPKEASLRGSHGSEARAAYNNAVEDLKLRMADGGQVSAAWMDMLTSLTRLIQQGVRGDVETAQTQCDALRRAYCAELLRLDAMRASAMGPDEQRALHAAFCEAGFLAPEWCPIDSSAGLVAWHFTTSLGRA